MNVTTITIDGLEIATFESRDGGFVAAFANRKLGLRACGTTEISAAALLIERYAEYLKERLIAEMGA